MTVTIYNTSNHTTQKVVGSSLLACIVMAMETARKLDPAATFVRDTNTVYVHY